MPLLDRRRHGPRDPDPVGAAKHELGRTALIGKSSTHGFGIFRSKVKDVADFDPALRFQPPFGVHRADIARHCRPQIKVLGVGEITPRQDMYQMGICGIRPDNSVANCRDFAVGNHPYRHLKADRPGKAQRRTRDL